MRHNLLLDLIDHFGLLRDIDIVFFLLSLDQGDPDVTLHGQPVGKHSLNLNSIARSLNHIHPRDTSSDGQIRYVFCSHIMTHIKMHIIL